MIASRERKLRRMLPGGWIDGVPGFRRNCSEGWRGPTACSSPMCEGGWGLVFIDAGPVGTAAMGYDHEKVRAQAIASCPIASAGRQVARPFRLPRVIDAGAGH